MNVMRRHVLRLVVVSAFTIAVPQLASAFDSETSAALKLAMGPTSAPQKNPGVPPATAEHTVTSCRSSERPCPKPHHHWKHRHAGPAAQPK
jgi:hypothetical protein